MNKHLLIVAVTVLLAGCGGNDPTPAPDEAASAGEIEASVNRAANVAEAAKEQANQAGAGE